VFADETAVHPHPGPVVHGAEPKVQPLRPGRPGTESRRAELVDAEPAAVPDDGVEPGVVDAGVGRLERERHADGAGELGRGIPAAGLALVVVVELEPPVAAQLVPDRPHELRTRIVTVLPAGTEITREGAGANTHALHHARTKKGDSGFSRMLMRIASWRTHCLPIIGCPGFRPPGSSIA
jgi:hypothetical protein